MQLRPVIEFFMGKKMETSRGKTSSRTSNKQTENTLGVMAGLVPFDRVRAKHFFFFLFFSLCVWLAMMEANGQDGTLNHSQNIGDNGARAKARPFISFPCVHK